MIMVYLLNIQMSGETLKLLVNLFILITVFKVIILPLLLWLKSFCFILLDTTSSIVQFFGIITRLLIRFSNRIFSSNAPKKLVESITPRLKP